MSNNFITTNKKCKCGVNTANRYFPHTEEGRKHKGQYIEVCSKCFNKIFAGES